MVVYLVYENSGIAINSKLIKIYKDKTKADKYAAYCQKRQKNKPQYDTWGLCEGIEYKVYEAKVN